MKKNYSVSVILIMFIMVLSGFVIMDYGKYLKEEKTSFVKIENPPDDIVLLLKESCYDCHSDLTNLPWYAKVPPAKWLVNDHVKEGKKQMNLSEWDKYEDKKRISLLLESVEEIEQNSMPLKSYLSLHNDAVLTEHEKERIVEWLNKTAEKYTSKN